MATKRLELPSALLPSRCPVVTKWVVLTGATSAGKSTTIAALEELGFPVIHEIARKYVEDELARGRDVKEVRANDHWFRNHVFRLTRDKEIEMLPSAHKLIFLDRSAVDSVSFHRASGFDPHEIVSAISSYRYAAVFHLTPLAFVNDGFRTSNEDRRHFIDAALERDYRALGYTPERVPSDTVMGRVALILRKLQEWGFLEKSTGRSA
jgi:predicted ATPase